jgi:hypothetical protein
MKKLILSILLLPTVAYTGKHSPSDGINLAEIRSGTWPINLERDIDRRDTIYSLIFRNQEVMNGVALDTLEFNGLVQLRYFEKALTALQGGHNGDIAQFRNYTLKREDKKFEGLWYLLSLKWSSTEFRQPEADIIRKTIKGL